MSEREHDATAHWRRPPANAIPGYLEATPYEQRILLSHWSGSHIMSAHEAERILASHDPSDRVYGWRSMRTDERAAVLAVWSGEIMDAPTVAAIVEHLQPADE